MTSANASKSDKYSSYHLRLTLDTKYATAPEPIPTTVVSNATIIAFANVLTSPAPNAARPGPIGIKVPINPNVGPIRVTISVFSIVFFSFNQFSG